MVCSSGGSGRGLVKKFTTLRSSRKVYDCVRRERACMNECDE